MYFIFKNIQNYAKNKYLKFYQTLNNVFVEIYRK